MKRKLFSLLLILFLLCTLLSGCKTISNIAGNVANAALEELEHQISDVLEEHKLEVIELKTVFGSLNGEGQTNQFFCAALIRSDSLELPQACADGLDQVFEDAGILTQTGSKVVSPYLVHQEVVFHHTDFSGGNYYTIYVYNSSINLELPEIDLSGIEIPDIQLPDIQLP